MLPFQNRIGATHLKVAALACDCAAVRSIFEVNIHVVESELLIDASQEGFFSVICMFGQLKPLKALLMNDKLRPLTYKAVLMYTSKPSFLDLCDREINYELFRTSRTQKMQLKLQMANLLQDALDYCVNQEGYEWKYLQQEWRKNPLYYYAEDDTEKKRGRKICVKDKR